jgi:hypothetical protein
MSGLTTGVAGAIALVLISGAAQFAMGRDLSTVAGRLSPLKQTALPGSQEPDTTAVNRGAKADRAAGPSGSPALLRTISLRLNGVSDTVILMRVPVAVAAPSAASSAAKPVSRRPMMACEPVVSVLTEVATRLQPGRCVT